MHNAERGEKRQCHKASLRLKRVLAAAGASPLCGSTAAMVQDLVLPRMRGAAAAAYSLIAIVVGSGVGPYWAGKVSKVTGSLNAGLYSILILAPVSLLLLWLKIT